MALLSCQIRNVSGAESAWVLRDFVKSSAGEIPSRIVLARALLAFQTRSVPELQARASWAALVNSSPGEIPCRFALALAVLQS